MKNLPYIIFCIFLISFSGVDRIENKSNKILAKTFKGISIKKKKLIFSSKNKDEKWHTILNKNTEQILRHIDTNSAIGRFDKFDFMVLYNPDKSIHKVRVLIYREDHGGEIANKRWLKQFEGKSIKNIKNLSKQINGISGATLSCNAITSEIKNSLITIQKLN